MQEISPKYFANLDVEKLSIAELTKLQDQYIESLLRAARVKAAEEKLIELDKERIKLEETKLRLQQANTQSIQQATGGFGSYVALEQQSTNTKAQLIAQTEKQLQSIKNQTDAVTGLIRANLDLPQADQKVSDSSKAATKTTEERTGAIKSQTSAIKEQKDRYKELFDLIDETEARSLKLAKATRAYYDVLATQSFQRNFGQDPAAPIESDIQSAFGGGDQTPQISFSDEPLKRLAALREK